MQPSQPEAVLNQVPRVMSENILHILSY